MGSHLWPVWEWAGRNEWLGQPRDIHAGLVLERQVVSPPRGHFRVKVKKELPFCSVSCESWEGRPRDLVFGEVGVGAATSAESRRCVRGWLDHRTVEKPM